MRGALLAFTLYHGLSMLVGGATKPIKQTFAWVFGAYDQGLRMTNAWGMFGKPPNATHVVLEGEKLDGSTIVLATTNARDRTLVERVRDVRIRKIQGKLAEYGDRSRWGREYLGWFCRDAAARGIDLKSVRAVNYVHELRDDAGGIKRKASKQTVVSLGCVPGPRGAPPSWFIAPPSLSRELDEGSL